MRHIIKKYREKKNKEKEYNDTKEKIKKNGLDIVKNKDMLIGTHISEEGNYISAVTVAKKEDKST